MAALRIAYSIKFSAIADYKCLPLLSKLLWLCSSDEVLFFNGLHWSCVSL